MPASLSSSVASCFAGALCKSVGVGGPFAGADCWGVTFPNENPTGLPIFPLFANELPNAVDGDFGLEVNEEGGDKKDANPGVIGADGDLKKFCGAVEFDEPDGFESVVCFSFSSGFSAVAVFDVSPSAGLPNTKKPDVGGLGAPKEKDDDDDVDDDDDEDDDDAAAAKGGQEKPEAEDVPDARGVAVKLNLAGGMGMVNEGDAAEEVEGAGVVVFGGCALLDSYSFSIFSRIFR